MTVNIIMIAQSRERLTSQALDSLFRNTDPATYNLTFVNDGGRHWERVPAWPDETVTVQIQPSRCIVGLVRNIGADFAQRYWGRGDWLLFLDNDVYVHPGWLRCILVAAESQMQCRIFGGYRHPFHGINRTSCVAYGGFDGNISLEEVDAVAGYSMLMSWETWDKYGPFDQHARGVGQSEDFALCQKIVKDGYKVGYVSPPVLTVCGLTNTLGEKVPGYEELKKMVPDGVYAE